MDLLDVSLKLNLSSQTRKQSEDIIQVLRDKNKELNSEIEYQNKRIRLLTVENKNKSELLTTSTVKIENLQTNIKIKEESIEKSRSEMKNNLTIFNNLLDKEKKIAEV